MAKKRQMRAKYFVCSGCVARRWAKRRNRTYGKNVGFDTKIVATCKLRLLDYLSIKDDMAQGMLPMLDFG
jgi:hypothetical protein